MMLYNDYISFYVISQGFRGQNLEYKGGNVKGIGILHSFWGLQGITNRNRPLDNWGFEF